MTNQFVSAVLMAMACSAATALIGRRSPQQRLLFAVWRMVCCVAAIVAGSWAMFAING